MSQTVVRRITRVLPALAVLSLAIAGPSHAANVGGGTIMGAVTFTNAGGLPPVGAPCANTTFSLHHVVAHAFVLNTVITGYAGDVTLNGSGAGTCENATLGMGTVTVTGNGLVATTGSSISCPTLTGTYIRVLTELTTVLFGNCSVNNFPMAKVTFIAEVNFLPDNLGADIDDPIFTATFQGGFTVSP